MSSPSSGLLIVRLPPCPQPFCPLGHDEGRQATLDLSETPRLGYRQLASYFGGCLYPGSPAQTARVTAKSPASWQPFERFRRVRRFLGLTPVTGGYA